MGSNCNSVGSRTVKERGEPNNQVAKSSEKFSAINLQILSNIVRDYFPFLLGYPRSLKLKQTATIAWARLPIDFNFSVQSKLLSSFRRLHNKPTPATDSKPRTVAGGFRNGGQGIIGEDEEVREHHRRQCPKRKLRHQKR
jgi:hypothetical protein